jgi:hypothetical protein
MMNFSCFFVVVVVVVVVFVVVVVGCCCCCCCLILSRIDPNCYTHFQNMLRDEIEAGVSAHAFQDVHKDSQFMATKREIRQVSVMVQRVNATWESVRRNR